MTIAEELLPLKFCPRLNRMRYPEYGEVSDRLGIVVV
jgi:hypothetical protein